MSEFCTVSDSTKKFQQDLPLHTKSDATYSLYHVSDKCHSTAAICLSIDIQLQRFYKAVFSSEHTPIPSRRSHIYTLQSPRVKRATQWENNSFTGYPTLLFIHVQFNNLASNFRSILLWGNSANHCTTRTSYRNIHRVFVVLDIWFN